VTKRFSREDLFTAIVHPSRDVAPAYRVTNFDLKRGQRVSGIVIFESADGYIIQANATDTLRLATEEIESLRPSPQSLMPEGLLKDLRPEDWADLDAYLRTL
jgi:putative heme-binding domain-containing protein